MKINIFKTSLFKDLKKYNQVLLDIGDNHKYHGGYTGGRDTAQSGDPYMSNWFDPRIAQSIPVSACFPDAHPDQLKPEYCLIIFASNYLSLFLINELYKDRKDVLIEDAGSGVGRQFYYLSKLGFTNFQGIDNFSQGSEDMYNENMEAAGISPVLNNLDSKPVIVTNFSAPFTFINPRFGYGVAGGIEAEPKNLENLELICFYSPRWDALAREILPQFGFKRLCYDQHGFSNAFCREDKHEEFSKIIQKYEEK